MTDLTKTALIAVHQAFKDFSTDPASMSAGQVWPEYEGIEITAAEALEDQMHALLRSAAPSFRRKVLKRAILRLAERGGQDCTRGERRLFAEVIFCAIADLWRRGEGSKRAAREWLSSQTCEDYARLAGIEPSHIFTLITLSGVA